MSKLKLAAIAFAALCCFRTDLAAQSQAKEARAGSSTVSGRVTVKDEPMRGVTVTLQPQRTLVTPSDQATMPRARTDPGGIYRITGVAPGRYTVSAAAPAYVSSEGYLQRGRALNVGEDENIENIDIELKRGGVITGRVTDSNGRPVVEEEITLLRVVENGKPQNFFIPNRQLNSTDDLGVYRLFGLPEGRYLVCAGYSPGVSRNSLGGGINYPRTCYPDAADQALAKPIEVSEGSEATEVDIVLGDANKTYAIYGRVIGETGQPVPGVGILFGLVSPGDPRMNTGWTGIGERTTEKGEFRLPGVAKGKYAIVARASQGDGVYGEPVFCEVVDSDVHGIEVKVKQGSTLSGTVAIEGTNDPAVLARLPKLQLYIFTRSEEFNIPGQGSVRIEPNGNFIVRGVQPGRVSVSQAFDPYNPMNEFSLLRLEHNGTPQPDGITIAPGENVTNVRVVFGYGVLKIRGEVKIVNGTLPGNMRLSVSARRSTEQETGRGIKSGEVDQAGRFVLENLMAGEYELRVMPMAYPGSVPAEPRISRALAQAKQKVVAGENQPAITITIDLNQQEGNQ
jgi:hypothetical protein